MAAPRSWVLWSFCCRGSSRVLLGCRLPGLRSSWPRGPLGARPLSQEKRATETHFGFETVSEEEKGGKVYQVFESVAKKYDVMNDMMSLGIHRIWKDLLLWKMRPFPGTQLLDVAGGTGDIAFRFLNYVQAQHQRKEKRQLRAQQNLSWEEIAKKYQNEEDSLDGSHVMVCDINKEMLKIGKQKARARGYKAGVSSHPLPPKKKKTLLPSYLYFIVGFSEGPTDAVEESPVNGLAWVVGDAEELPFDDDKFDVYTIAFGIRNVTHIDQALQEAHRVLKPGGRFLCLEFSQVNNPLVSRLYDVYSFQVIPVLGEVIAGDWKSYQYLVESIRQFPSQEEFKEMIEDAGFQKVTYENLTSGIVAIHSGFKL
ncbi:2-methoxy-6-polyprenyl-1,4-benzoquinol methylase, mitochondrial isoform X1 [Sagmatias obliquidens]|uniref:2-methoxy-6-polyprenyl-1,4-benzoquinol methylase, mitochondrial n=1 Tax=Tursiops truncatus TaxID=9739 RepID=A0A6J3PRZ9_TURTR|nr:2-methoxy-6-polyprenyl-1,4-benzoquinol methylase, mitochondrial isoform X1 [Lagenorhynchus obliquidens]XP_033692939.1 2-methoxy-6-polyprenyl-1,4-benzoquinol methylase, mitochondrial isoform X1 [Tursiops truncatus]